MFTKAELANIVENLRPGHHRNRRGNQEEERETDLSRVTISLSVVKSLLADVRANGVGKRYLIQHSAGSGKSNSIAWLAHQLVELEVGGKAAVDSVIVVTDRVNLDKQIRDTIKQFTQLTNTVMWAEHSGDLRKAIQGGKKIIITTVHKFPFILDDIGTSHKGNKFAIIIDEAHSSQSGNMSSKMNVALSGDYDPNADAEDEINALGGKPQNASQRQLLRIYSHAQKQNVGDVRRTRSTAGW